MLDSGRGQVLRLVVLIWGLSTCFAWRPGTSVNKVAKPCINSAWIALLINGFLSVKTWLLITFGTSIYAIIKVNEAREEKNHYSGFHSTLQIERLGHTNCLLGSSKFLYCCLLKMSDKVHFLRHQGYLVSWFMWYNHLICKLCEISLGLANSCLCHTNRLPIYCYVQLNMCIIDIVLFLSCCAQWHQSNCSSWAFV